MDLLLLGQLQGIERGTRLALPCQKNNTYSLDALREKQKAFGTIVLECDLYLSAEIAYKAYDKRWEIEIVMRYYKSACEFDETQVQDDYSVIGS